MPDPLPAACDCSRFMDSGLSIHRLDKDLELCVCDKCGLGWVRDLGPWTRLQDSMDRLDKCIERLAKSTLDLNETLNRLSKASK